MPLIQPLFSGFNARQPAQPARTQNNLPSNSSKVKFGCRLFAYIAPKQYEGQDTFVKQCMLTGQNSMKRQNQLPLFVAGSENPQVAVENYHEEITPDAFAYKAGWGIAASQEGADGNLLVKKSPFPTWHDKIYDQTVTQVAEAHPKVVMAHLREARNADKHAELVEKNAHPYKIGDWAMMQHGSFPPGTAVGIDETLSKIHETDDAVLIPESEVDTERAACYLAEKLRQQTGSTNIKNLETKELVAVFKESLNDIIRWPDPKGETYNAEDYPGAFNFVVSDGNRLLISRYSPVRPLYLGSHKTATGKTEYVVATDKMQPTDESGIAKIEWSLLPNNSITVLERHEGDSDTADVVAYPSQTLIEPKKAVIADGADLMKPEE